MMRVRASRWFGWMRWKRGMSLRGQLGGTFFLILALSVAASVVTYGLGYVWWMSAGRDSLRPANWYEQKLPEVKEVAKQHGAALLEEEAARAELERAVPKPGMEYQVVDAAGRVKYGSFAEAVVGSGDELVRLLNQQRVEGKRVTNVTPLTDREGMWRGALVVRYQLEVSVAKPGEEWWLPVVVMGVLLSPFVYVVGFTVLLARRFGKRIEAPIQELIQGAERIRQRDLDFRLAYAEANELGELTRAFEAMRAELKESLVREWRLEQERREMVAAIAHDLRTPLTIIQGHAEGLLEGGMRNEERLGRYLRTIESNAKRATQLIGEMNAVAEVERQDFRLSPEEVDVREFVEEKVREFAWMAEKRGRVLVGRFVGGRPMEGAGLLRVFDAGRVAQVLDNVVVNAMRFTPEGGQVELEASLVGDELRFVVCDEGPGFGAEDLGKVFQKFYQGDKSRSVEKGHAGLGLYIAKEIAEKHGGWMSAENRPDGGACVRIMVKVERP